MYLTIASMENAAISCLFMPQIYQLYILQTDFRVIEFRIIGDDSSPDFFEVNKQSGQIKTKARLDREAEEMYRVLLFSLFVSFSFKKAPCILTVLLFH